MIKFAKLHACMNSYIVVDGRQRNIDWQPPVEKMCNPMSGVGANGVLVARRPTTDDADIRMDVYNSDGTKAEISGNGLRIFTKRAIDALTFWEMPSLRVETDAGIRYATPKFDDEGLVDSVHAYIGKPEIGSRFNFMDRAFTEVNVGNPHAVHVVTAWMHHFLLKRPLVSVGESMQRYRSLFPDGVNVEFAYPIYDNAVRAMFYERGVGFTKSSGTGSIAAAAVCRNMGIVGDEVEVYTEGGKMIVNFDADDAYLDGEVEMICEGVYND